MLQLNHFMKQSMPFVLLAAFRRKAFMNNTLRKEWPEWGGQIEKIERETGVKFGKNQAAYRTATMKADGDVPALLKEILSRARSLLG